MDLTGAVFRDMSQALARFPADTVDGIQSLLRAVSQQPQTYISCAPAMLGTAKIMELVLASSKSFDRVAVPEHAFLAEMQCVGAPQHFVRTCGREAGGTILFAK